MSIRGSAERIRKARSSMPRSEKAMPASTGLDVSRGGDQFAELAYRFFRKCGYLETGPGEGVGERTPTPPPVPITPTRRP